MIKVKVLNETVEDIKNDDTKILTSEYIKKLSKGLSYRLQILAGQKRGWI